MLMRPMLASMDEPGETTHDDNTDYFTGNL